MSRVGASSAPDRDPGSVVYTAWVLLVLGLLIPPLWVLLLFVGDGPRAAHLVRECARAVVWATWCPIHVKGAGHLKAHGALMLVANHASLSDAAFLLAALPADFAFIANHAHAQYPILGRVIRKVSHHIVDRGSWRGRAACGDAMVDALRSGRSLLVFPEGTTSEGRGLLPFRNGAFRAAARSGRPIVPIAIRGTSHVLPPSSGLARRNPVYIDILQPIEVDGGRREEVRVARDAAVSAITARLRP